MKKKKKNPIGLKQANPIRNSKNLAKNERKNDKQ